GSFSSGQDDIHTVVTAHLQHFLRSLDDRGANFTGYEAFVSSDGGGDQDIIARTYAEQAVSIHDDGGLGDAFPRAQIPGFFPIQVGQGRLGARAVGMHDVAKLRVIAQGVFYDLAECLGKKPFVQLGDGIVDVFFGCGNSALHVALVHGGKDLVSAKVANWDIERLKRGKITLPSMLNSARGYVVPPGGKQAFPTSHV